MRSRRGRVTYPASGRRAIADRPAARAPAYPPAGEEPASADTFATTNEAGNHEVTRAVPTTMLDLNDERAITAVLVRYATGIDTRDWTLFRTCFSEDFEGDYGTFGRWRGPREITDFMRSAHMELGPTLHRISNVSIHRERGEVFARSYVDALLSPAKGGDALHRGIGAYDDRFVHTGRGWQIARRTFRAVVIE